ncbi:MAG: hypothetical protein ACOYN0_19655 [Phycisphaerales bacterium]
MRLANKTVREAERRLRGPLDRTPNLGVILESDRGDGEQQARDVGL